MRSIVIALTILFVFAPQADARCGPKRLAEGMRRMEVPLADAATIRAAPAFYLRTHQDSWSVVWMKPSDVVAFLRESSRITDATELLATIEHDLPLHEDTDLFKYSLRDIAFDRILDIVTMELAQRGALAIDFWPLDDGKSGYGKDRNDPRKLIRIVAGADDFPQSLWLCFDDDRAFMTALPIY